MPENNPEVAANVKPKRASPAKRVRKPVIKALDPLKLTAAERFVEPGSRVNFPTFRLMKYACHSRKHRLQWLRENVEFAALLVPDNPNVDVFCILFLDNSLCKVTSDRCVALAAIDWSD